ncbi:NAD-dependent epimerase/dehydratase family protein [Paenibacillus taichungensis]|uniref:NAD-dependent epimerase/dehydratase family protein n=1 Tax=Paenibacillus taichungensis TaxID=484184 RepID=UPI0035DECD81
MINDKPLTLITGANGKTGSHVAAMLQKHDYPVRLAGRKKPSSSDSADQCFVSADDIAAVAFHALTDVVPHNTAHIITGPETLS